MSESTIDKTRLKIGDAITSRYNRINVWIVFGILVAFHWVYTWSVNTFWLTDEVLLQMAGSEFNYSQVEEFLTINRKLAIFSYALIPITLLLKFALLVVFIQFILILQSIDVKFKEIFKISVIAQLLLVLPLLGKLFFLFQSNIDSVNNDLLTEVPLSMAKWVDKTQYSEAALALFDNVNLFIFGWIGIMGYGLKLIVKIDLMKAIILMIIVWAIGVVFQWVIMVYFEKVFI